MTFLVNIKHRVEQAKTSGRSALEPIQVQQFEGVLSHSGGYYYPQKAGAKCP